MIKIEELDGLNFVLADQCELYNTYKWTHNKKEIFIEVTNEFEFEKTTKQTIEISTGINWELINVNAKELKQLITLLNN